jgi:hypothetical protein
MFMCFFHVSEFFMTSWFKPRTASYDCMPLPASMPQQATHLTHLALLPLPVGAAYLVNHSHAFVYAMLASCAEFWLEALLAPGLKLGLPYVTALGVAMCCVGQVRGRGAPRSLLAWRGARDCGGTGLPLTNTL